MKTLDNGFGHDKVNVMQNASVLDSASHNTQWEVAKYLSHEDFLLKRPYEIAKFDGNILVNAGINLAWTLIAGGAGTTFSNANSYIGVGDSTTAEAASQTDLQAATNKTRVAMDSSYPTYGTSQQIVFRSTFDGTTANYAWQEFAAFNAAAAGTMLNRKVSNQGTKISGQTWQVTLTVTLS